MRDLAIAAACAHLPLRMRRQASQSGQAPSISARILQMFRVYALMVICVSVVESFSLACSTAYDVRARHDSMLTDAKQLYVSHYGLTRPDSTDPEPARLRLSTECISNYSVPVTVPITFLAQPNTNSQGTGRATNSGQSTGSRSSASIRRRRRSSQYTCACGESFERQRQFLGHRQHCNQLPPTVCNQLPPTFPISRTLARCTGVVGNTRDPTPTARTLNTPPPSSSH